MKSKEIDEDVIYLLTEIKKLEKEQRNRYLELIKTIEEG